MKALDILKTIILTMIQTFGDCKAILAAVSDDMEYKDHKSTGNRLGTRYSIVCPNRQYMAFTVKVPGEPIVTQEQLDSATEPVWVTFEGFQGTFYVIEGNVGISCKADKAAIVAEKKPAQKVSG